MTLNRKYLPTMFVKIVLSFLASESNILSLHNVRMYGFVCNQNASFAVVRGFETSEEWK